MNETKIDLLRSDQADGPARADTLSNLVAGRPDFARLAVVQLPDRGPGHWGVAVDEGYDWYGAEEQLRWLVSQLANRVQSSTA